MAASNEQPQAKTDLVVMSFNIRYGTANDGDNRWDKRKGLAFDVLRRTIPTSWACRRPCAPR